MDRIECKANHWCKIILNIDEELDFYVNSMGYKIKSVTKNRTEKELAIAWNTENININLAMIETENDRIELIELNGTGDNINKNVSSHYCYKVKDIRKVYDVFKGKKGNFLSQPQIIRNKVKIVFFRREDGEVIEFLEVLNCENERRI